MIYFALIWNKISLCVSCYRKMLFGFLHSLAIVFMDLKEIIIFMVLCSCQICNTNVFLIFSDEDSLLCLYFGILMYLCKKILKNPTFVLFQPNYQRTSLQSKKKSARQFFHNLWKSRFLRQLYRQNFRYGRTGQFPVKHTFLVRSQAP